MGFLRKKSAPAASNLRAERAHLINDESDFFILEAYKSLRTNVMFALAGEEKSQVILVTSSMQGEGKSTTAVNLAISFALAEKNVVLIDCDLRRPKLDRLLGLRSRQGLSNVLLDPELLDKALLNSQHEHLKVMLAGDIPPNPSELLSNKRMVELLEKLRERFDYIILDTPPVNVVTDAVVLSPLTDGTVFVVRSGKSERGIVMRAVEQLSRARARILGFVLNGVQDKGSSRYSHSGYGQDYAYAAARPTGKK